MDKRINIGSQVFFSDYEDYHSHDKDYVQFEDSPKLYTVFMNARGRGEDIFFYKTMPKEEFIKYEKSHCQRVPMAAGKFLIPELCEHLGITLEDIKQFEEQFNNMDEKHTYEKIIYDAYVSNGGFTLTKEQRDAAYAEYKRTRENNNESTDNRRTAQSIAGRN